jgi:hypothetical protein
MTTMWTVSTSTDIYHTWHQASHLQLSVWSLQYLNPLLACRCCCNRSLYLNEGLRLLSRGFWQNTGRSSHNSSCAIGTWVQSNSQIPKFWSKISNNTCHQTFNYVFHTCRKTQSYIKLDVQLWIPAFSHITFQRHSNARDRNLCTPEDSCLLEYDTIHIYIYIFYYLLL